MSHVDLTGVYIAPVSSLSTLTILNAGVTLSEGYGVPGDFRRYAGGRMRLVTRVGSSTSVSVAITHADRTTREALAALAGQTILLRDGRGRAIYGSFLALDVQESQGLPYCDLAFTLNEITTDVEV
jgi:hypothetical protein